MDTFGRLVAYVRTVDHAAPEGPVLWASDNFNRELEMGGFDLESHDFPPSDFGTCGLLVFEGWMEYGPGPEPDVYFRGDWRRLTFSEMIRLRCGQDPWPEKDSNDGKEAPGA